MKIAYVVNVDWFFVSHRLPLAEQAIANGDEVYILTANTGKKELLESKELHFIEIPFDRSGTNPIHEIRCIIKLVKEYKKIRPDVIHHITLKVSLLGCIAAKIAGVDNVVNAISGFGYMFTNGRKSMVKAIASLIIKIAFKSKHYYFILQNPDDVNAVKSMRLVPVDNIKLIKGSGIDLKKISYTEPVKKDKLQVLFPARILKDKGVVELIQSMNQLEQEYADRVKLVLAGDCDECNPAVLHETELKNYLKDNYIEWIGYQSDMLPLYQQSDIVALPSYREGLPKSLIEGCAVGRPILTTNAIGCKECVEDGVNGFMVPVKNVNELAIALSKLIKNEKLRIAMGHESRKLAEKEFSIVSVIEKTFDIYKTIQK